MTEDTYLQERERIRNNTRIDNLEYLSDNNAVGAVKDVNDGYEVMKAALDHLRYLYNKSRERTANEIGRALSRG